MLSDATPAGTGGLPFEGPDFTDEDLTDEEQDDIETEDDEAGNRAHDADPDAEGSDDDLGNRAPGGVARAVLEHVARSIVDDPDAVEIDVSEGRSGMRLSLRVSPSDMGRVIGRRGRVAQAIRTLVRAAAAREGIDAVVDIVDD
jgi:predicted RNA-binding protein YlqC (UPF0109 family)